MSMRFWKKTTLGLSVALVLGAATTAAVRAETLRVGLECVLVPFNYRTSDGKLEGYDVDVVSGIAEIMGANLEFACQQWDGLIPALLANKIDLIASTLSITPARLEKIDFSDPYRDSGGQFVGKEGLSLDLFDADGNPIPEAFDGLVIGVERSTTYYNWIDEKISGADIKLYDSPDALYQDLRNGRIDLLMTNPFSVYAQFLTRDEGKGYALIGPIVNNPDFFGVGTGIAFRKGQPELKARIDDALAQLIAEGKLSEYSGKYFPFEIFHQKK